MSDELQPTMKIALAINRINPNAKFEFNGNNIDDIEITWIDGTTPISKEDIKAMIPTVEQEKSNRKTARTSAINKLKGATYSALTDAEAKALFGE